MMMMMMMMMMMSRHFGAQRRESAETKHLADRDELLRRCRGSRRNHLYQFLMTIAYGVWACMAWGHFGASLLTCFVALTTLSHNTVRVCDDGLVI